MLLKPLTLVAGLLAVPAARAFLVPPEVSDTDIQVANTIDSIASQINEIHVDVQCPGCPVLLRNRRGKTVQFKTKFPSHLELTFSVDHLADHDRLLLNGVELYPAHEALTTALKAPQVVDRKTKEKTKEKRHHPDGERHKGRYRVYPQPQQLSFGLKVMPATKDAKTELELVEIEFQIIAVGVAFIDGIPGVKVSLVKDSEGRLLISKVEKGEANTFVKELPGGDANECTTALCRWISAAREKLKSFKGHCSNKGGAEPSVSGEASHPHSHPHHPAAGHGHQEHRWGKLLKHMASHILLPVLIGIVAGVSVSLIGMAVGTVLISLWRVFFRRRHHSGSSGHRRRHSHHKTPRKEVVLVEEEKAGLMVNQDAPPSYEEQETVKTSQV
ncbi:hypothetical protein CHGG_06446 [Chaetomium globosum CBS 148.51]|jgi:hypothetical protein|uniref:DUF7728 domain-containing protein n=1 Tax=Chaetomium globosum (strain ATCC 6205 / CBS 148.51 / DSM 1962 / NBRC 6347 / NRRL 1970) TaxID=306901 RepID=Q2H4G9_CHAGB|nr:uncharacterized protein CHGG_06446 [Chaetomium globosum CBS 148.51]EAQ89827.1 hypothetical protein CHGG_06446 [Chaetomium globosum CBS 148.51]